MRFAFIMNNRHVPWGGSEELWSQTALALKRAGHEVIVCMPSWCPFPAKLIPLRDAGCIIHCEAPVRFAYYRARLPVLRKFFHPDPWEPRAARDMLVPFRPDLVVISQMMNFDGAVWAEACVANNLPYVLIAQAANDANAPVDADFERTIAAYRQARCAFFVSHHNLALTSRMLGIDLNATVVRNPFLVSFQQAPDWPATATPNLACVARVDYGKGHDFLIKTLASDKWKGRDWSLTFFGDGPHRLSIEKMAACFGLAARIKFAGHSHSIPDVWSKHHLLVLPSRVEGLPLALVESALCHRACVITPAGGSAEVVQDGVTGFVADAVDEHAYADALERAWQRRENWREMGLQAGIHIRTLVPESPVGVFAELLLAAAKSNATGTIATVSCKPT